MARRGMPLQTECKRGHPLVEGNLYFRRDGGRQCRACVLANRQDATVRAGGSPHKWPLVHRLERERDEAQEAAETYWEAWQDAAVYWKERIAALEAERDEARLLLAEWEQMEAIRVSDEKEREIGG